MQARFHLPYFLSTCQQFFLVLYGYLFGYLDLIIYFLYSNGSGSPKKVLLSVKKCLLQAALVHPKVSFNLIDLERCVLVMTVMPFHFSSLVIESVYII